MTSSRRAMLRGHPAMTCLGRLGTCPITQSSIQPSQERSEWSSIAQPSIMVVHSTTSCYRGRTSLILVGVLMHFRQESVALMADVKATFHQVRVKPGDCSVLRFLWWPDGDKSPSGLVPIWPPKKAQGI